MTFDTFTLIQLGLAFGYFVFNSFITRMILNSCLPKETPVSRSLLMTFIMIQALCLVGVSVWTIVFILRH